MTLGSILVVSLVIVVNHSPFLVVLPAAIGRAVAWGLGFRPVQAIACVLAAYIVAQLGIETTLEMLERDWLNTQTLQENARLLMEGRILTVSYLLGAGGGVFLATRLPLRWAWASLMRPQATT